MKNQPITQAEYNEIIKRIKIIQLEKILLKEIKKEVLQKSHLKVTDPTIELILSLTRENKELISKIHLEKKIFLQQFVLYTISYERIQIWFEKFITNLMFGYQTSNTIEIQNAVELSILKEYATFEQFKNNIELLVKKREENLQLLDFIDKLLQEQDQLLIKKRSYEKQFKKKKKIQKKNTSKESN